MKIETKYDAGDEVFYHDGKAVRRTEIVDTFVRYSSSIDAAAEIEYRVMAKSRYEVIPESDLYPTREACLKASEGVK